MFFETIYDVKAKKIKKAINSDFLFLTIMNIEKMVNKKNKKEVLSPDKKIATPTKIRGMNLII